MKPLPFKIQVIDDFHFFSGEALFSMTNFEQLSIMELNLYERTTRRLLDFTKSSFVSNALEKEYAIGTTEGLCFVKLTHKQEIIQTSEYYLSDERI